MCLPAPSRYCSLFFFTDTATPEIYTLSLHDALPIFRRPAGLALRATLEPRDRRPFGFAAAAAGGVAAGLADAPPCATPRSRGGGAVEMLASRKIGRAHV